MTIFSYRKLSETRKIRKIIRGREKEVMAEAEFLEQYLKDILY
jgi:hypothetical protein